MIKHIIFISIDGMTDQLGQSQVLPYLIGLSSKGFKITIVSCEKKDNFKKNEQTIRKITSANNIIWSYCFYETKIPFISQVQNFKRLTKITQQELSKNSKHTILHCRNLMITLIGFKFKKKYGVQYIFDMRGFWADERIDGNIWSLKNPLHKFLYKYFKRKEIELIENADHVVALTNNAKNEIENWQLKKLPAIDVIPCCTDVSHFTIRNDEEKKQAKNALNINSDAFVVGYLGSLGTWYMLDEMLDFFAELQNKKPNSIFFFVTNDDEQSILHAAERKNIKPSSIFVRSAKRDEVPAFISCFDIGLFFIKPLYSKKGSSPTKLAEILACGIPVVTNTGVGDVDELLENTHCGVLVSSFEKLAYRKAIDEMDKLNFSKQYYRDITLTNFSLEKGVDTYQRIYTHLLSDK